jgi:hypothetical protein
MTAVAIISSHILQLSCLVKNTSDLSGAPALAGGDHYEQFEDVIVDPAPIH